MFFLKQTNSARSFSRGLSCPLQAARFIRQHPRLYQYIIAPLFINIVVFCAAIYLGLDFFGKIASQYIPQGDAWYWLFLHYFLWVFAILLTMVLVFFCFTAVGCLIAAPFNDLLSERTEALLIGDVGEERLNLGLFFRDMIRTIANESKKIGLFILGMVMLLLLNLLPVIGPVLYGILSTLWTLFFLVIEYMGYVFSRKRLSFREQRRFIFGRKLLCLGFGSGLLCILAIPFLQFFCIPLGVVGATLLYCETNDSSAGSTQENLVK